MWYTTRATGLVALLLLTATVVLGLLTAGRASGRTWPRFVQQDLHRRVSILTLVFLAIHVLTSVLDTYVHIGWLAIVVPFTSPYERFFVGLGAVSVDLMAAVMISSFARSRLNPAAWRAIHWLSYLSWPVAVAHSIGTGTDTRLVWVDAMVAACCLAVVVTAAWRFGRGAMLRRRLAPQPAAVPARSRTRAHIISNGRTG